MDKRLKVLIFIPAYDAEATIASVLDRIPRSLADRYDLFTAVIDDGGHDRTWKVAEEHLKGFWCPGESLRNPKNLGYGGNQNRGYRYAMEGGYDVVAMVHGDGQYAPEQLPSLLEPFTWKKNAPDAVYGSRIMTPGGALKGGMPRYKYVANRMLSMVQNRLIGTRLSEFHSGYRLYNVHSLRRLPLETLSDGFDFDTEIIIQLAFAGMTIVEKPIPTFYGDEVCHVNNIDYGLRILRTSFKACLVRLRLARDKRFPRPEKF